MTAMPYSDGMSQYQIKKLEEWAEGKPVYLVMLAMQVMPMAAMMADFIALLGERLAGTGFDLTQNLRVESCKYR